MCKLSVTLSKPFANLSKLRYYKEIYFIVSDFKTYTTLWNSVIYLNLVKIIYIVSDDVTICCNVER